MSLNIKASQSTNAPLLMPRITVVGIGGAGGNAVNNMIEGSIHDVDFISANTDLQSLSRSRADRQIQLGPKLTNGLGAGADPEVGMAAAEECEEQIKKELEGSHMVFVTSGMGGGTGTGSTPFIAKIAKEMGILTIAVVTKPFDFEGPQRMRCAERGVALLEEYVDTLLVIPNQNLFRVADEKTSMADAFKIADDVLMSGVKSITDLMVKDGKINLDFADVNSVMRGMGRAMMVSGESEGEDRAIIAAKQAISNQLLEDNSIKKAKGVLINITGGNDIGMHEINDAINYVNGEIEEDTKFIFGICHDDSLEGRIRISIVATGLDKQGLVISNRETEKPVNQPLINRSPGLAPLRPLAESSGEETCSDNLINQKLQAETDQAKNILRSQISLDRKKDAEHETFKTVSTLADLDSSDLKPETLRSSSNIQVDKSPKTEINKPKTRTGVTLNLFQSLRRKKNSDLQKPNLQSNELEESSSKEYLEDDNSNSPNEGNAIRNVGITVDPPVGQELVRENDDDLEIPAFLRRQIN